ncbi:MAG: septum formation protein Maf [Candidatus Hydrogenedentes bacterium]|nr:septum formation protein Maf [Candidatus Hydrogenedentota bacterium]
MIPLVLASASPRRYALLSALGIDVQVLASGVDEVDEGAEPAGIVIANAVAKRDDVAKRLEVPSLVIAADTLVFLGEEVLSKPADLDDARRMLRNLSGRSHEVVTGLAVVDTGIGQSATGSETTRVTFRELADDEIEHFVHAVKPVDRAGAYTVDGPGSLLVAGYEGCFQNVLGLPIVRLDRLLRTIGHNLFEIMDGPRATFL